MGIEFGGNKLKASSMGCKELKETWMNGNKIYPTFIDNLHVLIHINKVGSGSGKNEFLRIRAGLKNPTTGRNYAMTLVQDHSIYSGNTTILAPDIEDAILIMLYFEVYMPYGMSGAVTSGGILTSRFNFNSNILTQKDCIVPVIVRNEYEARGEVIVSTDDQSNNVGIADYVTLLNDNELILYFNVTESNYNQNIYNAMINTRCNPNLLINTL